MAPNFAKMARTREDLSRSDLLTYFGTESSYEERLRIFSRAVAKLENDFGQSNVAWGEIIVFRESVAKSTILSTIVSPSLPVGMASGRWGALASFGARRYQDTKRIYGSSGNSFVAVVEFGDKVRAKTLLAGGQSGNPDSPHFDDQAKRYVDRAFKEVAYYIEDVERSARRSYHPGET